MIVRKVFGPFRPAIKRIQKDGVLTVDEMTWHFFGIRGDGDMGNWVLTYKPATRKFLASNTGQISLVGRSRIALSKEKINFDAEHCLHPNMFLEGDTSLTEDDSITNILRRRLSPADIAQASAASIARR